MTKPPKILIVDDEQDTRELFATVLAAEGYQITVAEDGARALSLFKTDTFDLVITDLKMPGSDGLQLLREIRKSGSNADVITATGYGEVDSYISAMSLGAVEYIHKPVRVKELRDIVQLVLKKRKLR